MRLAWMSAVPIVERASGLVVASLSLGVLSVAAWLSPNSDGHGTHTQLSMPRCGWVAMFDKPCPTCGMTTSFSHAAEGDFVQSAVTQPMGALLSVLAAVLVWGGLHTAITGARTLGLGLRLINRWTLAAGFALLAGAWVYKLATWPGG